MTKANSLHGRSRPGIRFIGALALACGGVANGADQSPADVQVLREQLIEQTKHIETLKRQMAETDAKLAEIQKSLGKEALSKTRGTGTSRSQESPPIEIAQAPQSAQPQPTQPPQAATQPQPTQTSQAAQPDTVGEPPERARIQQIAQIFDQPGVLTPKGTFNIEPGLLYSYSSSNRVSLVGYTIIPALLIGLIDIREIKRNTFTPNITARYGVTNRFELEARLPYVYRSDSVTSREVTSGANNASEGLFSNNGSGIGDFEVSGRYQLNDGGADKPYYIGTLRFKSRTGTDPFEVLNEGSSSSRLSNGLQRELPTGSGFYVIQPGLTVLYPADPAVFFGSVNYQHNVKRTNVSLNTTEGPRSLGDVEPGGVFGFNFGMGLAINDRSSFSLGYDFASVGTTKIGGRIAPLSVRSVQGTMLVGYSHRIDKTMSLNVSVGVGVTTDTPDLTLSVRLPMNI
jgi:hypothetical protein